MNFNIRMLTNFAPFVPAALAEGGLYASTLAVKKIIVLHLQKA